jgi:MFS family permease
MLRALRHRDFRLLWTGQAVSLVGDGIYLVAIAWLVYDISNRPGALAIVGVAWTLPQVAGLLVAGVLSDRFERRRLLVIADVVRCLTIGSIAALTYADLIELWHVVALVVLYGFGQALFQPAFTAILPEVVPREELLQANAMRELLEPIGLRFAGPALGGALIALSRPPPCWRSAGGPRPAPRRSRCGAIWPRRSPTCARTRGCGARSWARCCSCCSRSGPSRSCCPTSSRTT